MSTYKKIIAAIDLADGTSEVLDAAQKVAKEQGAELHVITVIRPLNYAYTGFETVGVSQAMANFETEARESALKTLTDLCQPLGVTNENIHIVFGRPADAVKLEAKTIEADLVVTGSHGRHGLGLILGSTANGILHGTPCDVLTVRIKETA